MNAHDFFQLLQDNKLLVDAYVQALPSWVQYWMQFMGLVFLPGLYFSFKYKEARVIIAALIYSLILTKFILLATGPSLLWGLSHILFWLPACIYVGFSYKNIIWKTPYGIWLSAATGTMIISLVFDFHDVILFFV